MKTMRTLIAALALGACIGTATAYGHGFPPCYAPPQPINNGLPRDGSQWILMNVRWNGSVYEFSYVDPRPSLWDVGVRPGTMLM